MSKQLLGYRTYHHTGEEKAFFFIPASDPHLVNLMGTQNPIMREILLDNTTGEITIGNCYCDNKLNKEDNGNNQTNS